MATIYQRTSGGSWYLDWREDGKRRQRSLKTRDQRIAERELKRVEARLALGVTDLPSVTVSEITLDDFAEKYLEHLKPRASVSYRNSVRRAFERLTAELGSPGLTRIHTRDVEEQITRLAGAYAAATVNLHLKILRAGFNQAIRWDHLAGCWSQRAAWCPVSSRYRFFCIWWGIRFCHGSDCSHPDTGSGFRNSLPAGEPVLLHSH